MRLTKMQVVSICRVDPNDVIYILILYIVLYYHRTIYTRIVGPEQDSRPADQQDIRTAAQDSRTADQLADQQTSRTVGEQDNRPADQQDSRPAGQ